MHRSLLRNFAIAAVLTVAACGSGDGDKNNSANGGNGGKLTKVTVAQFPAPATYAGFYLAMDKGFYEEEGLSVEMVPVFGGQDRIAAAESGKADFAMVHAPNVALAAEEGRKVKIVGMKEATSSVATVSLESSGIKSPRDFGGKSIADTPGGIEARLLPALGRANGFDPASMTKKNMDFSVLLASLLKKDVDIVPAFYASNAVNFERGASEAGQKLAVSKWADYGLNTYGDAFITGTTTLQNKGDMVRKFLKATLRGFQYGIDHPDEAVAAALKAAPEERKESVEINWRRTVELLHDSASKAKGLGWVDEAKMKETQSVMLGDTAPTASAADLFTNEYLPSAGE